MEWRARDNLADDNNGPRKIDHHQFLSSSPGTEWWNVELDWMGESRKQDLETQISELDYYKHDYAITWEKQLMNRRQFEWNIMRLVCGKLWWRYPFIASFIFEIYFHRIWQQGSKIWKVIYLIKRVINIFILETFFNAKTIVWQFKNILQKISYDFWKLYFSKSLLLAVFFSYLSSYKWMISDDNFPSFSLFHSYQWNKRMWFNLFKNFIYF